MGKQASFFQAQNAWLDKCTIQYTYFKLTIPSLGPSSIQFLSQIYMFSLGLSAWALGIINHFGFAHTLILTYSYFHSILMKHSCISGIVYFCFICFIHCNLFLGEGDVPAGGGQATSQEKENVLFIKLKYTMQTLLLVWLS